ncbi:outer membrane protein assembly factor BamE [Leptothrix discophora]|uniref:Outer membrane protein assembly factor BamE n=1 Tax=Leptothrix discophora TaxID=89 RepID=A0ABT9G6W2_LEPDI|nr:outer membrane protein assembly factor BamE [Leptothrix discophora]MDP4302236.1 outer membrane protein assembly factor BamE [Leptothrix discophora]
MTRSPFLRFSPVAAALLAAITLAGCAASADPDRRFAGLITPYRMEVVQGNVVTQEMAAQLRPGLTREQVRGLLGSPLLADVFHADRWDYVFTIRRQGAAPQRRHVTVLFQNDKVLSFEAPQLPSEREFVDAIDVAKVERRSVPLALSDDQLRQLPLPKPAETAAAPAGSAASAPARAYPPLEPLPAR